MPNQKSNFQIKIIEKQNHIDLESSINEFCENAYVLNIKIMKVNNNNNYLGIITYLVDKKEY